MKKKELATVISQNTLAPDIYDMWLETSLAKDAKPGQFVAVYPRDGATLLPRPISICQVNQEKTALRLVYRKAGKGTAEFSAYEAGQKVALLGVLGNGFPLEAGRGKKVLLMGGGIGVPPILQLAKELEADTTTVLGYRNRDLFLAEDFKKVTNLVVATEDGSECFRCGQGKCPAGRCDYGLWTHAHASCHQGFCSRTSYEGIHFTGRENGLRCGCMSRLRDKDQGSRSSFPCT